MCVSVLCKMDIVNLYAYVICAKDFPPKWKWIIHLKVSGNIIYLSYIASGLVAIDRYIVIMGHCGGDVCVCTYGSQ